MLETRYSLGFGKSGGRVFTSIKVALLWLSSSGRMTVLSTAQVDHHQLLET